MERVCVGAVLLRGGCPPMILLGKRAADRAFSPDVWDMLGGPGEPGETPEQALVRELEEGVGVTPTAGRPLGAFGVPVPPGGVPLTLRVSAVTAWSGTPTNRQPGEHAAIAWFSVADAGELPLAHPDYPGLFRRLAATDG